MKQQKLSGYKPNYPKKPVKGLTLAAAALLTIGAATGCRLIKPQIMGDVAVDDPMPGVEETLPPEELQTKGMVPIGEMETPEIEEAPMLMGDVAIIEP